MATRPTTAPIQKPNTEGFLPRNTSKNIQLKPAAAAAVLVVAKAETARLLAPRAEPALKPNQPNHSKPVPISTYGMLAGGTSSCNSFDLRGFSTSAPARAAQPAEMCTTVPPAKSSTPILNRKPSGCHVQWANGAYTSKPNNAMKRM